MADEVLFEKREDRIAILTLNRPQAMNAIDRAMTGELRRLIRVVDYDPEIDVLIVTGAGEKSFCVGVDLKERQTLTDDEAHAFRTGELFPMFREFDAMETPKIAVVDGYALGGGFEIVLASDMILATPASIFGLPEVKWGLIPSAGGCRKLPRLIGAARAKEVILAATTLTAGEAARMGVINRVVEPDKCMHEALALAVRVAENADVAVRGAKRCIDDGINAEAACAFDIEASNHCYSTKERKEGIAAFAGRKS